MLPRRPNLLKRLANKFGQFEMRFRHSSLADKLRAWDDRFTSVIFRMFGIPPHPVPNVEFGYVQFANQPIVVQGINGSSVSLEGRDPTVAWQLYALHPINEVAPPDGSLPIASYTPVAVSRLLAGEVIDGMVIEPQNGWLLTHIDGTTYVACDDSGGASQSRATEAADVLFVERARRVQRADAAAAEQQQVIDKSDGDLDVGDGGMDIT